MRSWSSHGPTFDSDLVEFGRACYNLNRQHGAAQVPAAQPAAPAPEPGEEPTNDELFDLARAIVDHWNPPTAPPAPEPGEVADSVEWLGVVSEQFRLAGLSYEAEQTDQVATLLQHLSAPAQAVVPVAVSERLPQPEDCNAEGVCWFWEPGGCWWEAYAEKITASAYRDTYTHWLPAHAIPLPQAGEVEV